MKASLLLKVFLVLPLILFVDYILMAAIGCSSCLFGLEENFYCGPFCLAAKILLGISALFFAYLVYHDIRHLFSLRKHIHPQNNNR